MKRIVSAACLLLSLSCAPLWAQYAFKVSSADRAALESLEVQPAWTRDYDSYLWLEGDDAFAAAMARLDAPFERMETAGTLRVHDHAVDPVNDRAGFGTAPRAADGRFFGLVQFRGPLFSGDLDALRTAGLEPVQYYSNHAYLVWGSDSAFDRARGLAQVRWSGDFGSEVRIQPALADMDGMIRNVNVHFYNDGDINGVLDALRAAGATLLDHWRAQPDGRLWDAKVEVRRERLEALAAIPQVVSLTFLSPEPQLEDESAAQTLAGNLDGSNIPVPGYMDWLVGIELDGSGVIWSVTDSGVWYGHGDFNSRIVGGFTYPGCTAAPNPGDELSTAGRGGHGTHVTGIIAGDGAAGFMDPVGHLYGLGVAPGSSIFAQNPICGTQNSWPPAGGWQVLSRNAILGGALGTNNSWTTGEGTQHGYQASERTHDIMTLDGNFDSALYEPFIIVFSAGNSGFSGVTAPKEAKNVIVTGSTNTYRAGSVDGMSSFSSRGPAVDGRILPTISAPGGQVSSAMKQPSPFNCSSAISGTGSPAAYAWCSGTSMAAPHASGSIVLMAEWWRNHNGGEDFSPAMAKALLVNSAIAISGAAPPNNDVGWGRIDLRPMLDSDLLFEFWDQEILFEDSGEEWSAAVNVVDPARPFKVSLVWSDAPGAVGANPALVNDLDLEVEMDGETYLGNVLSGGWSAPGGTPDRLNNLESVFVEEPVGGAIITARAHQIAGSVLVNDPGVDTAQHFALVCQNCLAGTPRFIGGEVQGLAGEGLVLQNNGEDDLLITEDGPFTFPGFMIEGQEYAVTVAAQPVVPEQECEVENGEGTVGKDDISDVLVSCETLPVMAVTSPALDFGEVHIFESESLEFEVENIAPVPARTLDLVSIQLMADEEELTVTGGDCHAGIELAAGTSCVVEVTFGPEVTGEFAGTVVIESADGQIVQAELNGIGVQDPGEPEAGPQALDFGEVGIGNSALQSVTVSNIAHATAAALELETVQVIAGEPDFAIDPDGSDCDVTLAPQQSCTVAVQFTPAGMVAYSGVLRIAAAGQPMINVTLSGNGIEPDPNIFEDRFEQN